MPTKKRHFISGQIFVFFEVLPPPNKYTKEKSYFLQETYHTMQMFFSLVSWIAERGLIPDRRSARKNNFLSPREIKFEQQFSYKYSYLEVILLRLNELQNDSSQFFGVREISLLFHFSQEIVLSTKRRHLFRCLRQKRRGIRQHLPDDCVLILGNFSLYFDTTNAILHT